MLSERRRILEALVDIDRRLSAHEDPPPAVAYPPRPTGRRTPAARRAVLAGRALALGVLAHGVVMVLFAFAIVALAAPWAPPRRSATVEARAVDGPSYLSTGRDARPHETPLESPLASTLRMHALFDGARPLALEPGDLEDPLMRAPSCGPVP